MTAQGSHRPHRMRRSRWIVTGSIYYHVTPRCNLWPIRCTGLLTSQATGRRKVVWLVESRRMKWALEHVAKRHDVPTGCLAIIGFAVARNELIPAGNGLWMSKIDIPSWKLSGLPWWSERHGTTT